MTPVARHGRSLGARAAAALLGLLLAVPVAGPAVAEVYERGQVEAAYLLNFIRYTQWPPDALPPPEAPLIVVVYRAPQTADVLEAIAAAGERVGGREIEVRRANSAQRLEREIGGAHVLYVGSEADPALALGLAGDMVLTVGSAARFGERGGMLTLVPSGNRLVFDANVGAIRASGLTMSAKVLALARRVEGKS